MRSIKRFLIIVTSFIALGGLAFGMHQAVHSKLFIVQSVEVESSTEKPPLSDQTVLRLAAVPIGKVSLFQIDLNSIERRLLSNDWVSEVRIQKRFLHKLLITVIYREPLAIVPIARGNLGYVDANGKVFGSVDLLRTPDLPFLSGFNHQSPERVKDALQIIHRWESSPLKKYSLISSVTWDSDRGFRVLASYSLGASPGTNIINLGSFARTMIDLGNEVDANLDGKLLRLVTVFKYLSGNSIAVRQIWADAGKKIVVKTAHGS